MDQRRFARLYMWSIVVFGSVITVLTFSQLPFEQLDLRFLLLALLAEAEQLAGRPEEALRLLDDALAQANRSGERYFEAEFHRLKGESLLAVSPPQAAQAEAAFTTAIAVARRQGAKLLEDRAAASLGRLRTSRRAQSAR